MERRIDAMSAPIMEPIDTAPRDGTEILLQVESRAGVPGCLLVGHWMPGGYCIEDHPPIEAGWYFWNGSRFDRAAKPAAWLPLPALPRFDVARYVSAFQLIATLAPRLDLTVDEVLALRSYQLIQRCWEQREVTSG